MSELIVISYCLFVAEFALTPSHSLSRSHHHATNAVHVAASQLAPFTSRRLAAENGG
jgi:hypothetical protein